MYNMRYIYLISRDKKDVVEHSNLAESSPTGSISSLVCASVRVMSCCRFHKEKKQRKKEKRQNGWLPPMCVLCV